MITEQFKCLYRSFTSQSLLQLPALYRDDIVFVDPVHRIDGLPALQRYFSGLAENLVHCEFVYDAQTVTEDSACICWHMHFQHRSLARSEPLSLRGITRICFDDSKIYHHEDFYDLGAMVYEHVPVLGGVTRFLKRRLTS